MLQQDASKNKETWPQANLMVRFIGRIWLYHGVQAKMGQYYCRCTKSENKLSADQVWHARSCQGGLTHD